MLPDDINVYGMKAFLDLAISENMKFEYKGPKYNFNTNVDSLRQQSGEMDTVSPKLIS